MSLQSLLSAHDRGLRTNWQNDGRAFQKEIERTGEAYTAKGLAVLKKVDPPSRLVGSGAARKTIFLANPFPDFVGSWRAKGGRALFVEAKSTQSHRLPFARSGGLTANQVENLICWNWAGAAVCCLWQHHGAVRLFGMSAISRAVEGDVVSLVWADGAEVGRGEGNVLWDFLPVLERETS